MKGLLSTQSIYVYLVKQPIWQLWGSTCIALICLVSAWYVWGYQPLLVRQAALAERFTACTALCEKDQHDTALLASREERYKAMRDSLQAYKGSQDPTTFYHAAVDTLLRVVRASGCSLGSLSSEVDCGSRLCQCHKTTMACAGSREAIMSCLQKLSEETVPWKVASVSFEQGNDALYHMTLGLECRALL